MPQYYIAWPNFYMSIDWLFKDLNDSLRDDSRASKNSFHSETILMPSPRTGSRIRDSLICQPLPATSRLIDLIYDIQALQGLRRQS